MVYIGKNIKLGYAHKVINQDRFIYPILGLKLDKNSILKVGYVDFVDSNYLFNNIIDKELQSDFLFINEFNKVTTFAVIDLRKYNNYKNICKDGNNSLALQILKQTIGALYLAIYSKQKSPDCERKIVISNKVILEVEEGLNSYMSIYNGKYMICPNIVSEELVAKNIDYDMDSIKDVLEILKKDFKYKTDYEKKICKTLEIIYSIYNEEYSSERVIKWAIALNYIFRENDEHEFDSTYIGRKLRIIFNVIDKKEIYQNLPKYIFKEPKKTRKISDIVISVYKSVRNDLMHGKIDFYTEYGICNVEELLILKVTVHELLKFMTKDEYIKKFKNIKEFSEFIEAKEAENIRIRKQNK